MPWQARSHALGKPVVPSPWQATARAMPRILAISLFMDVRNPYEVLGRGYATHRRPDPGIAELIRAALGSARIVVNVGAGTGAYEPMDRQVTAVEPARMMIAQRSRDAAPVVQAFAERLPFADRRSLHPSGYGNLVVESRLRCACRCHSPGRLYSHGHAL